MWCSHASAHLIFAFQGRWQRRLFSVILGWVTPFFLVLISMLCTAFETQQVIELCWICTICAVMCLEGFYSNLSPYFKLTVAFIIFIIYLLTPWSIVLFDKLTSLRLAKKFPTFCGTQRFIATFTSACHLPLSWASSIQSIPPYPTSWRSILILSSYLHLGLPSGLCPLGFPTRTLYTPLPSPIHATCPAYLILLNLITHTILGEEYRPLSSSLCSFLHSPVTPSVMMKPL